jgi:carbamoyl-phosphate synthase small subunit
VSEREAALALEDGSVFVGRPFGADAPAEGEVVFNTAMTGYQEICTDASYRGQLVVLTHPQVGNYGVSSVAQEAERPWVAALLVRELAQRPHHWASEETLDGYLRRWGVPGLEGIDTRALTRRLRARGAMRAVLRRSGPGPFGPTELARLSAEAERVTPLSEKDLVGEVSRRGGASEDHGAEAPRVVVVDYGYKANIVRSLRRRGAAVETLSWDAGVEQILAARPDGIVLSNGPGDPAQLDDAVRTVRRLMDSQLPIMGICLGHQILGRAAGAATRRLPFGHHGGNHPVKELPSGRVAITSQNHEFEVQDDPALAAEGFVVSHVSLNDGSVEGLRHRELPIFSVQFHPEGCPGPQDSQPQFDHLFELMKERSAVGDQQSARGDDRW